MKNDFLVKWLNGNKFPLSGFGNVLRKIQEKLVSDDNVPRQQEFEYAKMVILSIRGSLAKKV